MTPDDNRIDLDAENLDDIRSVLAKDVAAATNAAKAQKAKDAARDTDAAQDHKDTTIKYGLIVVGALLVFFLAYWMTFIRGDEPVQTTTNTYGTNTTAPPAVQVAPQPAYPQQPINRPPANSRPQASPRAQSDRDYASPDM